MQHSGLGKMISSYEGRGIGIRTWILILIPAATAIFFFLLYGMLLAWEYYLKYGPASAMYIARPWYVAALILLVLSLPYFLYRLSCSLRRIDIFENAMIYRNSLLRRRLYYWSDIKGITSFATAITLIKNKKQIRTEPSAIIYLNTGKPIKLTKRFENIPLLVEEIKSMFYPQIWPKIKSSFLAGSTLDLGRISLSNNYLFFSNIKIPWQSINQIKVESGNVVIELHDKNLYRVPVSEVQNLELFFQLVDWGIRI